MSPKPVSIITQVQEKLSPAQFVKYCAIRRRIWAHDSRPTVITPLKPMHRAILAMQYANASR